MMSEKEHRIAFSLLLITIAATQVYECSCKSNCSSSNTCSTWLYHLDESWCKCGSNLGTVIVCSNDTQEVSILSSYCLTSFNPPQNNCSNDAVAGRCLYSLRHGQATMGGYGLYVKVHSDIAEQNKQLCGYLNREGRLCGKCKQNHFVSPYSYDFKCHHCQTGLLSNIAIYLAAAYLPLTVFLAAVMAFRISVTAPHLNATVVVCQLLVLPANLRYITQITRNSKGMIFVNFTATVYGIWNLDFFRTIIPPICLPLNTMQLIALDYLVAVYPLLLLACFYILLTAHDRGCRLVVRLWKPFLWCTARLRQQWNVRYSIIDAFATFLLLSQIKFLNTSTDLLLPTEIFNVRGAWVGYFLYYDATVELFGHQHLPYAIIAIAVFLVVIILPVLLLLLYPMMWFQKCLNKWHLNSPGLQIFMQCFQGYYRDKTDGGWECRYFAALYPVFRVVEYFIYATTRSTLFFPITTILVAAIVAAIVVARPYKKQYDLYNKLDILMLMSLIVYTAGFDASILTFDKRQVGGPTMGYAVSGLISFTPLLYFTVWLMRWMKCGNRKCFPVMQSLHGTERNSYEDITDNLLDAIRPRTLQ